MYLKKLELFGFKSFPEKTSLTFEPGTTVVVGPNGCGKSNIFDSIKWALGEQSPKSLRGTKMEDIIFNGTQSQPPLSYAEVSLSFCNEDEYLPIGYKEVAVARRLYRSGESQYFINKNPVRLKDVSELFMGTGIGESTYSFVEQGKIEIFLSYKPEDKRLIFDEASGIVKYKERRREALRRLDETEENILRLDDIFAEVRRQIRYLERQVEKAKKYKEVEARLIETEKEIASLRFFDLDKKIADFSQEINQLKEKESQNDSQLEQAGSNWEELNNKLKALGLESEEKTAAIVSLTAQIETFSSQITVSQQRIEELDKRNLNLDQTDITLHKRLELQAERTKAETERIEEISQKTAELRQGIEKIIQENDTLKAKIEEAKKEIAGVKATILDSESRKANLHNLLIEMQTKLSSLVNRKKRLLLDKAKLETLLSENKERFQLRSQEFSQAEKALGDLQAKKNKISQRNKEVISRLETAKVNLTDKEKEFLELNASYEFLKDLRVKYETFSVKKKIKVIFDEEPKDINKLVASLQDVEFKRNGDSFEALIEAKVISFEEDQLTRKLDEAKAKIEESKLEIQGLEEEKIKLSQDLTQEDSQIEEMRVNLQANLQEKDNFKREVSRLEEEFELLTQEEEVTLSDIEDFQKKQESVEAESALCQEELNRANENLAKFQEIVSQSLERIKEIDIATAQDKAQIQALDTESKSLNSKISLFQDEVSNLKASLEQTGQERTENSLQQVSLGQKIEELKVKIEENNQKINESTASKQTLDAEKVSFSQQIDQIRQATQSLENQSKEIKDALYNKKLEAQSLEYEKEKVKDYLKQVYDIEFEPAQGEAPGGNIDDLSQVRDKLQKRKKSLGEVNLVAIEEFEELKKREEFMENQKQDLITAKDNLRKAIAKINRTSKDLFLETFTKIQDEFKKNFKFLFNGGRANLILLDPENVLESGVEIEVQPPGKKLQNVSLLSGGEKSLTAISLIFAIFRVRPSPLCVLDEIDAPLDEANVERFNHLLKEFASTSQFVIITHNKRTMSNADVLYGVTMQERGISKLVSVKFAAEEATPA